MTDSPFIRNEHGLWCPACGEHLNDSEGEPDSCRVCGYPDFEDGPGYFTDEEVET